MTEQVDKNAENIQLLTRDVAGLTSVVSGLGVAVERLITHQEKNSKTNWSTLASWAAVIISIVTYLNHLNIVPIQQRLVELSGTDRRQYDMLNLQRRDYNEERTKTARLEVMVKYHLKHIQRIEAEQKRRTSKVYKRE